MALPKLFQRIFWHNNTTPAINEDNLNAMSKGLSDVDDRVVELAGTIMETVPALEGDIADLQELAEKLEEMTANPPYIGANGNWFVWDTQTEAYVDSGIDASITVTIADITMLSPNATPYVTNTGTSTDPIFHLFIPQGKAVSSIAKTGTSGLVDTYTITYNDGTTTTYTITNGKGIASLYKTGSSGLTDVYTITYTDGTYYTFNVVNGKPAYQSAVEGGYQGTEAEFYEELGNFSTWAQMAEDSASACASYAHDADLSAQAAEAAESHINTLLQVPQFTVDFSTGCLMHTMDAVYSFSINQTTGNLEWEVVV